MSQEEKSTTQSKILFFPVFYSGNFEEIIKKALNFLRKKEIKIYYIEQWEKLAEELEKEIKRRGIKVEKEKFYGCSKIKANNDFVICDGRFHLKAFEGKIIWINPLENEVKEIELKREIDKRIFYALQKNTFGIIVSTKPGQFNVEIARKIKKALEKMGKEAYIFICDDVRDLENFPFVEVWINTACPRIKDDFKDILFFNADEIMETLFKEEASNRDYDKENCNKRIQRNFSSKFQGS